MSKDFKPMLASPAEFDKIKWPMYASVKLDGIRASVVQGRLLSRSLKPIPNQGVSNALGIRTFDGLDGELIVGLMTSPDCYRTTVSGIMSKDKTPNWTYHVFDLHGVQEPYYRRMERLQDAIDGHGRIQLLPQVLLPNQEALDAFEASALQDGHEGVILRHPDSPYKFGRSTAEEGYLLKVKRFVDGEAVVLEVIEEMHNGNEATKNELGRTKRSSHQENKIGKGRMGALLVRDLKTKVEFQIGTGFTDADKVWWWSAVRPRETIVKYKSFPIGVKDKPRHPVYLGLRDKRDMS